MNKILTTLAIIFVVHIVSAQSTFQRDYDWSEKPLAFELSEQEQKLDQVMLRENIGTHYLLNDKNELEEYNFTHRIYRVNTDKGIERLNKFYIYNQNALRVIKLKARVINPDGKIFTIAEKDIKEFKNENGQVEYKYFAFEGLQKGSTIEFLEIEVYRPRLTGNSITIQNDIFKRSVSVEIVSEKYLEFQTSVANGMAEMTKDTTVKDFRRMYSQAENLKGLKKEYLAPYERSLQKLYYKLQYNHASGKGNFYNYSNVAGALEQSIFAPLNKKDAAALKKFLTKNEIASQPTLIEKVRKLENAFKSEINIIEYNSDELKSLSFIFSKKIASETGCLIMYINALRSLDVAFEVVITTNRNDAKFIPNYEAYNFLDDYLIYVNELKLYTQPTLFARFGNVDTDFLYTDGLFLKEVKIGELSSLVGKVKAIEGPESKLSRDDMQVKVDFENDLATTTIHLLRTSTGYKAMPYQMYLQFMDLVNAITMKEDYAKYPDPKAKLVSYKIENEKVNDLGVNPFVVTSELKSDNLLENAGDKYLFKVGELIGLQAEMYDETPRELPVESEFNREYVRKIEVKIPEGFAVKNIEDLLMNIVPDITQQNIGFTSKYVLENNVLTIDIREWYNQVAFSLTEYPAYQKVINAAADFNKIVVVIEKK